MTSHPNLPHLLVCAALVASASAQSRWVVDLQNRPGTDFSDLPAAVAAVLPGDVLFLREQTSMAYTPPGVITKGLSIIGESSPSGPVPIFGPLVFDNLGNRDVTLTNLSLGIGAFNGGLTIENCNGIVVLDGVRCWGDGQFTLRNCQLAYLRDVSAATSAVGHTIDSCRVFAQDCDFDAFHWLAPAPPALRLVNANVELTRCEVRGSASMLQPTVAVDAQRSELVLDRNCEILGLPSDIIGDQRTTVRSDPGVNLGAGVTAVGGTSVVSALVASLVATPLRIGTTAQFDVFAAPQGAAFVGVGFSTRSTSVIIPGLSGAVWLNGSLGIDTLGVVVLDGQGTGSIAVPVPATASLLDGVAFTIQALAVDATGTATLTNPASTVLRR